MAKLKINKNYGVVPNEILNSQEISFKAKGLFAYIQSKPDGWEFSSERISSQTNEGLTSVRSGLKELESAGFLIRRKFHNEYGYFEVEYILFDKTSEVENPMFGNPMSGNPTLENYINNSNKEISKKESVNKSNSKKDLFLESDFFKEIFERLWVSYGRKGSKKESLNQVKKLNEADLKSFCECEPHILEYVEKYADEPIYRKDFERYISNKYWESEIVKNKKPKSRVESMIELQNKIVENYDKFN